SRGDVEVALGPDVDELIKGRCHPLADVAVACGTEGEANRLEPALVVVLEYARDEKRDGMRAEIGGEIGDADLVVGIAFALPQARGAALHGFGACDARATELIGGRWRDDQIAEG